MKGQMWPTCSQTNSRVHKGSLAGVHGEVIDVARLLTPHDTHTPYETHKKQPNINAHLYEYMVKG